MIPIKPKNVIWSDEQWQAIHEHGKNILVSAGAGSGKTAVLTERIIEILKKGVSIDRLIVLTFTKAAASEMKERVRSELQKIVSTHPELTNNLTYLDQANIQTFDSFALEIVKKYHYFLDVSREINIGDKVLLDLKRKEIINDVFNDFYESENKAFYDFINTFTIKNDNLLQQYLFQICLGLDLLIDKDKYLESYIANYYNEVVYNDRLTEYLDLIKFTVERIRKHLRRIDNIITDEVLVNYSERLKDSLADLLASRTYRGFRESVDIKLPQIPRNGDIEEKELVRRERVKISDLLKELKSMLSYASEDEIINELKSTKDHASVIIKIVKEVESRFWDYKKKINLFDFLDIAKLAITLFETNNELRDYYQSHIYEILIDEYQDTNDIQEALISKISNNNVYMVGDIKQSIYRFRNANPEIFKNKYLDFKASNKDVAIDLVKNFRSRKEVLDNINLVFNKVMSLELGGVDYDDNHSLKFGNLAYLKNIAPQDYNFDILTYESDESDLTSVEKEAFIVARDIKKKINEKYQVFDKKLGTLRDAHFGDFTILASGKKNFETYKKVFEYFNLPLVIHKEEDFIRSNEIYVIKNILRAIHSLNDLQYYKDNFKDAILSLLRSFLVEASDKDISLIFLGDIKEGLNLRFPKIYSSLINISRKVENLTLSEILGEIYKEFDIYYKLVKLGDVEDKENKLNYFLAKFSEFDNLNFTLLDAINYLEEIINSKDLDIDIGMKSEIAKDAINMMTIHMSKGLEFPVCYYVDLSVRFVYKELNDRILFDKEYGIIIPVFREGLKDTILKKLLKQRTIYEEISERLRIFYVALTRAKEKMIIVSSNFTDEILESEEKIDLNDKLNYKSFYDILNSIRDILIPYTKPTLHLGTKDYEKTKVINLKGPSTKKVEIREVVVKKEKEVKEIASASELKLYTKEELEYIELGTKLHEYLEFIDLKEDLDSQLDLLNIENNLKQKLKNFYSLDIFKEKILNIYKELPFSYSSDNILYQGIIDLVLELVDKFVIIDFKLSNLEKKEYIRQLSIYKGFIKSISEKYVETYLYSIMNEELKKV